jgi:hypothetical protein
LEIAAEEMEAMVFHKPTYLHLVWEAPPPKRRSKASSNILGLVKMEQTEHAASQAVAAVVEAGVTTAPASPSESAAQRDALALLAEAAAREDVVVREPQEGDLVDHRLASPLRSAKEWSWERVHLRPERVGLVVMAQPGVKVAGVVWVAKAQTMLLIRWRRRSALEMADVVHLANQVAHQAPVVVASALELGAMAQRLSKKIK